MEDLLPYLQPTRAVDSDHPELQRICQELHTRASDQHQTARRLFEHVRDSIRYTPYTPFFLMEHYRASSTLQRGSGYCVQKAVVLAALARAAGIPARLHFADIINHQVHERLATMMGTREFVFHCYTEMYLGGDWVPATPAFDRALCEEHGYPLVHFDGEQPAIFPERDERGRPFVEYLRHHGSHADVPLGKILEAWKNTYGADRVESWKQAWLTGEFPSDR